MNNLTKDLKREITQHVNVLVEQTLNSDSIREAFNVVEEKVEDVKVNVNKYSDEILVGGAVTLLAVVVFTIFKRK